MTKHSGLTPAKIYELRTRHGMTLEEIGKMYGLTKSGVSYVKRQGGPQFRTPREAAMENFPWKDMDPKFKTGAVYQRITNHLEYIQTGGRGMSKSKLRELSYWYKRFSEYNIVLVHDPNLPPRPGIKCGGWDYVPRLESDGDLLLRENEYTTLTDEAREIWRIPDKLPQE